MVLGRDLSRPIASKKGSRPQDVNREQEKIERGRRGRKVSEKFRGSPIAKLH